MTLCSCWTSQRRYRRVVDPDTLAETDWDQRIFDRLNADPKLNVVPAGPMAQYMVRTGYMTLESVPYSRFLNRCLP